MLQKYIVVDIGTVVLTGSTTSIRCELCGDILSGRTQQIQIKNLFKCLNTHMAPNEMFEIYEQKVNKIITSVNKGAFDRAKKRTKYKKVTTPVSSSGEKGE